LNETKYDGLARRFQKEISMTTLHLSEVKSINAPVIVRKRPMDRMPVIAKAAEVLPPKGANIFSLARVICKRAGSEHEPARIAA
jgi:hypothetical protein